MKMARLSFVLVLVFTIVCMVMRATLVHASVIVTVGHLLGSALGVAFFIHYCEEWWSELTAFAFLGFACAVAFFVGKPLPFVLAIATILPAFVCISWGVLIVTVQPIKKWVSEPTRSLEDLRKQRGHDRAMEAIRRTQR